MVHCTKKGLHLHAVSFYTLGMLHCSKTCRQRPAKGI
jgi:hypothetical protein